MHQQKRRLLMDEAVKKLVETYHTDDELGYWLRVQYYREREKEKETISPNQLKMEFDNEMEME
jgi:hypothetical protein